MEVNESLNKKQLYNSQNTWSILHVINEVEICMVKLDKDSDFMRYHQR